MITNLRMELFLALCRTRVSGEPTVASSHLAARAADLRAGAAAGVHGGRGAGGTRVGGGHVGHAGQGDQDQARQQQQLHPEVSEGRGGLTLGLITLLHTYLVTGLLYKSFKHIYLQNMKYEMFTNAQTCFNHKQCSLFRYVSYIYRLLTNC